MPQRTLYLKSYDLFREILLYQLPDGKFAVLPRFGVEDHQFTFGSFTREGEHVAGIFATPDGPAFFLDTKHVVGRFGHIWAASEEVSSGAERQFTLTHEDESAQKTVFSILYRARPGIGTNPYDTELEDVDLFAMIAAGLRNERFFRAYTRDWVPSP